MSSNMCYFTLLQSIYLVQLTCLVFLLLFLVLLLCYYSQSYYYLDCLCTLSFACYSSIIYSIPMLIQKSFRSHLAQNLSRGNHARVIYYYAASSSVALNLVSFSCKETTNMQHYDISMLIKTIKSQLTRHMQLYLLTNFYNAKN